MKLFVCGATGYIGRRLMERAAGLQAVATSSRPGAGTLHLDLAQPEAFDAGPIEAGDLFVLAAAISSPDVCGREPERARAVNVTGALRTVERVRARGARVVFLSSDTVYGEQAEPFDEAMPCRPAGAYAAMKHEVERELLGDDGCRVLRLSYVFSAADRFTGYLRGCAAQGTEAEVFDPFVRAVVHREDVVEGLLALARPWDGLPAQRVFNFGGPAAISRREYVQTLRELAWPALRFRIVTPEPSFFENRPRCIAMASPGFAALLGRPPRSLAEATLIEKLPMETQRD